MIITYVDMYISILSRSTSHCVPNMTVPRNDSGAWVSLRVGMKRDLLSPRLGGPRLGKA